MLDRRSQIAGTLFDRRSPSSLASALAGGADLVVDTIGFDSSDADGLIYVSADIGQLVSISSASVYADAEGRSLDEARAGGFPQFDSPIPESNATVAPSDETYSTRKVAMETRLLDAMRCPVALLRPCAIHGPQSRHPREWWFVKRLLDGRRVVPIAHHGASRFHTTSVTAIADLTIKLADCRQAGIFNVGDAAPPTVAEIGRTIADHLKRPLDFAGFPGPPRGSVGRSPWSVPRDFVVDTSAARAIGADPATYAATAPAALDWLVATAGVDDWPSRFPGLAAYGYDMFDYAAEDAA